MLDTCFILDCSVTRSDVQIGVIVAEGLHLALDSFFFKDWITPPCLRCALIIVPTQTQSSTTLTSSNSLTSPEVLREFASCHQHTSSIISLLTPILLAHIWVIWYLHSSSEQFISQTSSNLFFFLDMFCGFIRRDSREKTGDRGSAGRAGVLLPEGRWFDSPGLYIEVTLGKILNPQLMLVGTLHGSHHHQL